jgi:hypothetical protein
MQQVRGGSICIKADEGVEVAVESVARGFISGSCQS